MLALIVLTDMKKQGSECEHFYVFDLEVQRY